MKKKKIIMVSSSGGHYEQLKILEKLEIDYDLIWITEKTDYIISANYYLVQLGSDDIFFVFKLLLNFLKSLYLFLKEKPDIIISTGAAVSIPFILLSKIFKKKLIFIETFARIYDGTRTGKFAYKFADLFIVQWEELLYIYPNAVYGGSIY